jgi:hypothetical protein
MGVKLGSSDYYFKKSLQTGLFKKQNAEDDTWD